MTDEQILYGLECCCRDGESACDECPYSKIPNPDLCLNELLKDIFLFIKRQNHSVEWHKATISAMHILYKKVGGTKEEFEDDLRECFTQSIVEDNFKETAQKMYALGWRKVIKETNNETD